MNKKDIYQLITFSTVCFLSLAIGALFMSSVYFRHYNEHEKERQVSQQKFEQLIENVKSGKWQLSTDKWIEGMKLQRSEAEAGCQASVPFIKFLQFIGWFAIILAACNALIVLYVRNKIKKRQETIMILRRD